MTRSKNRPKVLVNASAMGFYKPRNREGIDESASAGKAFLSEVCNAWEREAPEAERLGIRVVLLRIGVVLGQGSGALARMLGSTAPSPGTPGREARNADLHEWHPRR